MYQPYALYFFTWKRYIKTVEYIIIKSTKTDKYNVEIHINEFSYLPKVVQFNLSVF